MTRVTRPIVEERDADVVAVLHSGDLQRLLDRAQRRDTAYRQNRQREIQVPVIPFFGFQGDEWSSLLRGLN